VGTCHSLRPSWSGEQIDDLAPEVVVLLYARAMSPWVAALWGAFGVLMVEFLEFHSAIRRFGKFPWKVKGEPGPLPLLISVIIRVGAGYGITVAAISGGQIIGAFGAIAIGAATPLLLEQLARVSLGLSIRQEPEGQSVRKASDPGMKRFQ